MSATTSRHCLIWGAAGLATAYVGYWAAGSVAIFLASIRARRKIPAIDSQAIPGIKNFRTVDERVWRGGRPTDEGYRELAARGVRTIVDLRAESNPERVIALLAPWPVKVLHLPVRDGQPPTEEQTARFVDEVANSSGPVFVHCGAGVGRTGSMTAAYLVANGQRTPQQAMRESLAVGPPSLEQIAYMRTQRRPPLPLIVASRLLDAPRRIRARIRAWLTG